MDPETASIRSSAPSYVSQTPSYAGTELPPYYSEARLPSYSSRYSSLVSPSCSTPRYTPASHVPQPHSTLPPMALISPDRRNSQFRQYEAVAARRHAKNQSASPSPANKYSPSSGRRASKRATSGRRFEDFSSLHPAPSTPQSLVHSTAELFLCTCGRPNHRRGASGMMFDTTHPASYAEATPASDPLRSQVQDRTPRRRSDRDTISDSDEEALQDSEEVSETAQRTGDPDAELLDAESKSWDFMFSQMH